MLVEVAGPADDDALMRVRLRVFVDEQGVPEEMERDEHDATSVHVVARCEGEVVGTGRLVPPAGGGAPALIGRLAVLPEHRGEGVGRALLGVLESCALERGWRLLELHAQTHALGFYEQAGWTAFGEPYDEAGIEHLSMRKTLG